MSRMRFLGDGSEDQYLMDRDLSPYHSGVVIMSLWNNAFNGTGGGSVKHIHLYPYYVGLNEILIRSSQIWLPPKFHICYDEPHLWVSDESDLSEINREADDNKIWLIVVFI